MPSWAEERENAAQKLLLGEAPVAVGPFHQPQNFVKSPVPFQDHSQQVLAEGVQGIFGDVNSIHIAGFSPLQHDCALQQILSVQSDHPAFHHAVQAVPASAKALQKGGDGLGRADLQDQIDMRHVYSQLQRGGGADRPQRSPLETALRIQPSLPAHGAVVAGGVIGIVELGIALPQVE